MQKRKNGQPHKGWKDAARKRLSAALLRQHRTADELVAEGQRLSDEGMTIIFLYPSQEWMAVDQQLPFLRYKPMN